jgi:hypothetical protein
MKVVMSSLLRTGRFYPQDFLYILVLIFRGCVDPRAYGSVGSYGKKFSAKQLGIDPETLRVVAQRLNHYATPGPLFIQ